MQLHPPSIARVRAAALRAEAIGTIFEHLTYAAREMESGSASVILDYQHRDDAVSAGDLVPVITLSVRPATIYEKSHVAVPQETT